MLNLSEQWKKAYADYLLEEEERLTSDIDKLFVDLSEAHEESKRTLGLVESYFEIYAESESILNEKGDAEPGIYAQDKSSKHQEEDVNNVLKSIITTFGDNNTASSFGNLDYTPSARYTVEKISDMKFPNNLIFFVKQIISWIGRVFLYFIEKFKNIMRRLVGDHASVTEIDYDKLKLNLADAKKVESFSTRYDMTKDIDLPYIYKKGMADTLLREGLTASILKQSEDKGKKDKLDGGRTFISLDLSKDIEDLKQVTAHFYDLFDNAFGTFNEKLFESEDLKIILKLFNETLANIKNGDPAREISLGGVSTEFEVINSSRVKDNLITTNRNITALKEAYVQTAAKIKDIAKIINSKELLMLSDLGIPYKMISSATLTQMLPIVKSIPERLKEAKKMEKGLEKVQKEYDALVKKLSETQKHIMSLSNITYDTTYNRRLQNLFVSARYMTDIVTLRLSGIALYIKELKDVRDILVQLNGFNKDILKR